MVVEDENGYVGLNPPKVYWNKLFHHVKKIMSQHNPNYSTTFIILILSKIFTWLNYTFHSIYSNTSPSTKHNLPIFFLKKIGCVEGHIPIFLLHNHFDMSKKLHLNTIQTIELHISFQLYQKYLFESTVLFTQYILTPVNPLNTIYQIIYFNILWVCWLLVYTCKPLLYTKKLKERCYLYNVQHL